MVLIESHQTDERQPQEATKATPSSSKTLSDSASSSNVNGGDAASDGFETASERDVSENEEDDYAHDHQPPEQKGPDSYQDALNDEELKEVVFFPSFFFFA